MASLYAIIRRGYLEVGDGVRFRTHADVLRLFGTDVKVFQRAFAKHPHEEGVHIWFPMFYDDTNNDWDNTKTKEWEAVFERRKFDNDEYLTELFRSPERHRRILFAKVASGRDKYYQFQGVYHFDPDASKTKAVYRRIATTTALYT
jgi:hypothetical protein